MEFIYLLSKSSDLHSCTHGTEIEMKRTTKKRRSSDFSIFFLEIKKNLKIAVACESVLVILLKLRGNATCEFRIS